MIESFTFDHTSVKRVPYVRLSKHIDLTSDGNICVRKFDIRMMKPNTGAIDISIMHTIEHILSIELDYFCEFSDVQYIDFSPMGCQTGYYMSVVCRKPCARAFDNKVRGFLLTESALSNALNQACSNLVTKYTEVPYANERECGNYLSMNLDGAKSFVKSILSDGGFKPFELCI